MPLWLGGAGLAVFAIFLFNALEARRNQASAPSINERQIDRRAAPAQSPELHVPEPFALPAPPDVAISASTQRLPPVIARREQPTGRSQPSASNNGLELAYPSNYPSYTPPPLAPLEPTGQNSRAASQTDPGASERVYADRLANPSMTIPQGALIGAVLETALDSTRGGQTRALVTRDVRGFDGSQILIPRGSRLIGEYAADLSPGQNRALVKWTRIIRPDGITIALDSPAADTLGRAGIKGSVNSHLLERVTNAVLGSAINLGMSAATRKVTGSTVIVNVPVGGNGKDVSDAITGGMEIRPTLKVKQGTRVTVFVARDLDFSSVDGL